MDVKIIVLSVDKESTSVIPYARTQMNVLSIHCGDRIDNIVVNSRAPVIVACSCDSEV